MGEGGLDVTVTDNDSVGVGGGGDFDTGVCSPLGDMDGLGKGTEVDAGGKNWPSDDETEFDTAELASPPALCGRVR